tara:strand:- start:788 stop:1027 length:240 start_codon:yes stop_codon:yes gene_type:complete
MITYSLGLIGGYATAKLLTPLLPSIKTKNFHIHHWIWSSTILLILYGVENINNVSIGLLTGIALQGLSYKNWNILKTEE